MKIEAITLRELKMCLKEPFETSSQVVWERRVLLLEVNSDGLSGWAEITTGEDPFYNPETTDTAWHIVRDFLVPLTLGQEVSAARQIPALVAAVRGHEMAKAGLENAVWDLEAQRRGMSLARLLGGTRSEIACGASIGIQKSNGDLIERIERELRAGYQRIKIKIKPGKDLELIGAVRDHFPSIPLMVDCNSAYRLEDGEHLRKLDQYGLLMIEQPLEWDDIYQHAQLQSALETPVCLDESIHNVHHAQAAIALGACRVINIKLGRVGGHNEALRIEEACRQNSVPAWCGGMLESGVGRAHNIAMSALPGFVLPGDVSASQRYWEEDIVEPEVEVSSRGTIAVPEKQGLGFAVRLRRVEQLTVRQQTWRCR